MTFGVAWEDAMVAHFLEGETISDFGHFWLILGDDYPGRILNDDGVVNPGYSPMQGYTTIFGFSQGGTISNILPIKFPVATGDWGEPVGGFSLSSLATGEMLWGAKIPGDPVFIKEWERVVFEPFNTISIQDGRELVIPGYTPYSPAGRFPPVRGHFSNFAEDAILNQIFNKINYAPPTNVWIGLLTADPGDGGTNANCNEVPMTAGGYTRVAVPFNTWSNPQRALTANTLEIVFPEATLNGWGTVTYLAFFDVEFPTSNGNLLIYGPLRMPWEVTAGSLPKFEMFSYRPGWSHPEGPVGDGIGIWWSM